MSIKGSIKIILQAKNHDQLSEVTRYFTEKEVENLVSRSSGIAYIVHSVAILLGELEELQQRGKGK